MLVQEKTFKPGASIICEDGTHIVRQVGQRVPMSLAEKAAVLKALTLLEEREIRACARKDSAAEGTFNIQSAGSADG